MKTLFLVIFLGILTSNASAKSALPGGYLEIMVVGGNTGSGWSTNVEVVALNDISDDNTDLSKTCKVPKKLPKARVAMGAAVASSSKEVVVCGGWVVNSPTDECITYSFSEDSWKTADFKLKDKRSSASWVMLDDGKWMVFGGSTDKIMGGVKTTEVLADSKFEYGPEMPGKDVISCAARVNATHVFKPVGVGGAYLLNVESGAWTGLPNMNPPRADLECGLTKGNKVVVAGGYHGTKYFKSADAILLDKMEWIPAGELPVTMEGAATVQLEDTFLIVGGKDGESGQHLGDIYQFNPENNAWLKRRERLKVPRSSHAVVRVPSGVGLCDRPKTISTGKPPKTNSTSELPEANSSSDSPKAPEINSSNETPKTESNGSTRHSSPIDNIHGLVIAFTLIRKLFS